MRELFSFLLKWNIFLIFFCVSISAKEYSKLPEIISVSNLQNSAFMGDKIELKIISKNKGEKVEWIYEDHVFCKSFDCIFDTSNWGPGRHQVQAFVFNSAGEVRIDFYIHIKLRPVEKKYELISALMKKPPQSLFKKYEYGNQSISALYGDCYEIDRDKIESITNRKRRLLWNKKLQTSESSALFFGEERKEEYYLLADSTVVLLKDSKRKALVLEKGSLRARNKLKKTSVSSVLIDSWLQIDGGLHSDFYVEKLFYSGSRKNAVRLTVLKGSVKIRQKMGDKLYEHMIQQEHSIVFDPTNPEEAYLMQPPLDVVLNVLEQTSPIYIFEESEQDFKPFLANGAFYEEHKEVVSLKQSLILARKKIFERNFFHALEILKAIYEQDIEKDTDIEQLYYLIAHASKGLYLFDQATDFYLLAMSLSKNKGYILSELGEISLVLEEWEEALADFDRSSMENQKNLYYRGVINSELGHNYAAKNNFIYTLWLEQPGHIEDSSIQLLNELKKDEKLILNLDLKLIRDSNPLNLEKENIKYENYSIHWSNKVGLDQEISFKYFNEEFGEGAFISRTKYNLSLDYSELAHLRQHFLLANKFEILPSAMTNVKLYFGVEPAFGEELIANTRLYDIFGLKYLFQVDYLDYSLIFCYKNKMYIEPDPKEEKIFEPLLWRVNNEKDRSYRKRSFDLSLDIKSSESLFFNAGVSNSNHLYSYILNNKDSHTDTIFSLSVTSYLTQRLDLKVLGEYRHRDFYLSDSLYQESRTLIHSEIYWKMFPNYSVGLEEDYFNQSSDENFNYDKWRFYLGFRVRVAM